MSAMRLEILDLFDEVASVERTRRYRWPLYLPKRNRKAASKAERLAKYLAWQKADRKRSKLLRVKYAVEPLPFPMSCLLCRRGAHHEMHFSACQAARR